MKTLMLKQTQKERHQHSIDIQHIMENVVNVTSSIYIQRYGAMFERKLGLTEDDLMNDIREQVWKGLLTHKKDGDANLKTYINTIIKNRFLVLYDRSLTTKYNSLDYYADAFSATGVNKDFVETEENGESLLEKRQEFMKDLVLLSEKDRIVFKDLILGFNLNEMVKRNKMPLTEIVGSIKRIDEVIRKRRANQE